MPEGLTPDQHRAADLLGRNWTGKDVATEIGVSEKTVQRWKQKPEFQAVVKERRDAVLAELPNAKSVLESALNATRKDGSPDWQIRVAAAKALMTTVSPAPPPPDAQPRTIIYLPAPEDDHDDTDA